MQIKKLFKFLPITIMASSVLLATAVTPPYFLNNSDASPNQIFNATQQVDEAEYTDQLDYIRNDVSKQTGVTDSVKSIKLSNNNSYVSYKSAAALVTKTDGSTLLYMWGYNSYGQLGFTRNFGPNPTPTLVTALSGKIITQVALGLYHSAALLDDGSLYMWGSNDNGRLGIGTTVETSVPTLVTALSGKKITKISLGCNHSAAIVTETDGSTLLYMWGFNGSGQLGNKSWTSTSTPILTYSTPFGSKKITQIALGYEHSAVLLDDGSLYMWGNNEYGQLGNGTTNDNPTPTLVSVLSGKIITQVSLGTYHSAAIVTETDGSTLLYMWGSTNPTPTIVTELSGKKITQITLGVEESAAIVTETDGSTLLYMWSSTNPTPTIVTGLSGKKITQIAFGQLHCAALLDDGSLYMWGNNEYGQLGNGTTNNNHTPSWMSKLGKDSHITANTAITAKAAVDKFWVNNKFNLTGFKSSFNLINIPDTTDQEISMTTAPSYDNNARTVTMNVKIKYYYDKDGLIVADTAAKAMTISGFKEPIKTNIAVKTDPLNSVVVDKWKDYVTVDGQINRTKLQEFLVLTDVPNEAVFTITENVVNNKTGVLTFKIATNKVIDGSGVTVDTPADFDPFPITLNLTPRITKMTALTTGYPSSLTATALKAKLFDDTGLVKDLAELQKYMTIVAPVDNVQYHLATWNPNDGDGTVEFSVYASKYYDDKAIEQTGGASVAASKVSFNLKLQPETSSITLKTTLPDVRIDKFEAYIKNNGSTIVRSKLEEFFVLTNVPSAATFTAKFDLGEYDANNVKSLLKLKLTIDKFNQGSPATPQTYTQDFELTLTEQHAPTMMQAKPAGSYNDTIPVNKFFPSFVDASGIVTKPDFLKQYVDIISVPETAKFSVKDKLPNEDTGAVTFKLVASQAYNAGSDPITNFEQSISLLLGAKPKATAINVNPTITAPERVDRFTTTITELSGTAALKDYLFPKYLTLTGNLPDNAIFTVTDLESNESTGIISFTLWVSRYYDVNGELKANYRKNFSLSLGIKYLTTSMTANLNITNPDRVDVVKTQLETLTDNALKNYLIPKYVTLTGDVPANVTYRAANIEVTEITGVISFDLILGSAYDVNADLVNDKSFAIELMVGIKHLPTSVVQKSEYDHTLRVDRVANNLKTLTGVQLQTYLEQFFRFSSLLEGTVITAEVLNVDEDIGEINFNVVLDRYYDADSNPVSGNKPLPFTLMFGQKHAPTTVNLKTNYKQDIRIDKFIEDIQNLEGQTLYNYLVQDYLSISGIVDANVITASVSEQNYDHGTLRLKVEVPSYYDADSELVMKTKITSFNLALLPKYTPTAISIVNGYRKDLTPTKFIKAIDSQATIDVDGTYTLSEANISFLSSYINFTSVPPNTIRTLTVNAASSSDITGLLSFSLSLDQHYNADGEFVLTPYQPEAITLNLATKDTIPQATNLTTNPNAPIVASEAEFKQMIYHTENIINMQNLALFVNGLDTIPSTAKVLRIKYQTTGKGIAIYGIEISSYYNGTSADAINENKTFDFEVKMKDQVDLSETTGFEWWWIAIAVGGAVILGLLIWLIIKKTKQNKK